jgi:hypothetical protein
MKPKEGSKVKWKWYGNYVHGTVEEVHKGPLEKTIKGSKIKRNGTVENPAYVVKSEAGNLALKLSTELEMDT